MLCCIFITTSTGVAAAAFGAGASPACENEVVAYETYIGAAKNVKMTRSQCAGTALVRKRTPASSESQNGISDVCGAPCSTQCLSGMAGFPIQSDCAVIADALLFQAANDGSGFGITANGVSIIERNSNFLGE
ncbi:hypothetical protein BV20DRAFT_959436 [Pilatotrama ljubarskyi]|nr:hypothetical protein BV20DRAFT_959436 [Pilatotrama ljubarskyi]